MGSQIEAPQTGCHVSKQGKPEGPNMRIDPVTDEKFLHQFLEASHRIGTSEHVSSDVVFVAICTKESLKRQLKPKAKVSSDKPQTTVVECGLSLLDSRHLHPGISEKSIANLISTRYFSVYTEIGRSPKPAPCKFAETEFIPSSAFRSTLHKCLRIPDARAPDLKTLRKVVIVNTSLKTPAFMHLGGEHLFNISRTIDVTALARNTLQVEPKTIFAHLLKELRVKHKEEELINCGNLATFMMHALVILAVRSASRNKGLSEHGKAKLEILKTFAQRKIMAEGVPLLTAPACSNADEIEGDDDTSNLSNSNIAYGERPKPIPNVTSVCAGQNRAPKTEGRPLIPRNMTSRPSASTRHPPKPSKVDAPSNIKTRNVVPAPAPPRKITVGTAVASPVITVSRKGLETGSQNSEKAYTPIEEAIIPVAPIFEEDTLSRENCYVPTDFTVAAAEILPPVHKTKNITNADYWKALREPDESEDEEDGGVSIYERYSPNPEL